MTARTGQVFRKSGHTSIELRLNLDGTGASNIVTGIGFLDYLLGILAQHARFDLNLSCDGDIRIDDHYTVEDCGVVIGQVIDKTLEKRTDVRLHGAAHVAVNDALARAVVDLSCGGPFADVNLGLTRNNLGSLSCQSIVHLLETIARHGHMAFHVDLLKGKNDHHRAEAAFKAVGMALKEAVTPDSAAATPRSAGLIERGARG